MLFFIPGAKAITPGLLEQHGLDRLIDRPQSRETYQGPAGAGLLIADLSVQVEQLAYDREKQTWSPRFGHASMVGTWSQVAPESLERRQMVSGPKLELLDGQLWQIPLLREWREQDDFRFNNKLPRVAQQCQTTGRMILSAVIPKYRQLWENSLEIANALFAQLVASESASLDDSLVEKFVIDLLAANYRVDASVISHLQLLTADLMGAIVRASLDWDTLRAHLKNRISRPM